MQLTAFTLVQHTLSKPGSLLLEREINGRQIRKQKEERGKETLQAADFRISNLKELKANFPYEH